MTVFKGGSVNPINPLLNRDNIAMGQAVIRLQPVKQLKQSVGVGSYLVTKRITRGAQSAANTGNWPSTGIGNLSPDGKTCRNGLSPLGFGCGNCGNGYTICGGPCLQDRCDDLVG